MSQADVFSLPGSSVGRFYPYDCIVASIEPQHARTVKLELQMAGYSEKNSRVVSGDELIAASEVFRKGQTADERFAQKVADIARDFEEEYLALGRAGGATVIVRTPTTILQTRVRKLLDDHGASAIRFYHATGIDDL